MDDNEPFFTTLSINEMNNLNYMLLNVQYVFTWLNAPDWASWVDVVRTAIMEVTNDSMIIKLNVVDGIKYKRSYDEVVAIKVKLFE